MLKQEKAWYDDEDNSTSALLTLLSVEAGELQGVSEHKMVQPDLVFAHTSISHTTASLAVHVHQILYLLASTNSLHVGLI